jgi:hypothetical protein
MALKVCESSVRNLQHVTILEPKFLRWLLKFVHPCTGLYILHITGQANRNGSVGGASVRVNKYTLILVIALSPIFDSHFYTEGKPVARGVKLATMHPLQIWMHPLGIRKISNTNKLISALKTVRHTTASTACHCWIAEVGNSSICKVFCAVLKSALCN